MENNFENNILELQSPLYRFALKLTENKDEANDLFQETYLKALSNKDKFKKDSNISSWTFTIMKNIFINEYRIKQKSYTINDFTDNNFFLDSTIKELPLKPDELIQIKEINKEIELLSKEKKQPFMMYVSGYKYREIAEELNKKIGTIKSRIFFAKKELIETLNEY